MTITRGKLIVCKSHDKVDVYYSAGKDRDDIFVTEYKTKLPSEQEIESILKKQSNISESEDI